MLWEFLRLLTELFPGKRYRLFNISAPTVVCASPVPAARIFRAWVFTHVTDTIITPDEGFAFYVTDTVITLDEDCTF